MTKFVRCWFSHGTVESIQAPDEIYFGALEQNIGWQECCMVTLILPVFAFRFHLLLRDLRQEQPIDMDLDRKKFFKCQIRKLHRQGRWVGNHCLHRSLHRNKVRNIALRRVAANCCCHLRRLCSQRRFRIQALNCWQIFAIFRQSVQAPLYLMEKRFWLQMWSFTKDYIKTSQRIKQCGIAEIYWYSTGPRREPLGKHRALLTRLLFMLMFDFSCLMFDVGVWCWYWCFIFDVTFDVWGLMLKFILMLMLMFALVLMLLLLLLLVVLLLFLLLLLLLVLLLRLLTAALETLPGCFCSVSSVHRFKETCA